MFRLGTRSGERDVGDQIARSEYGLDMRSSPRQKEKLANGNVARARVATNGDDGFERR